MVTSQFPTCPCPFHLDTWRGCVYGCLYCFARDIISFHRRNTGLPFSYLEANNPRELVKWIRKAMFRTTCGYLDASQVAFRERIPLKIGALADPFPPNERKVLSTWRTLEVLHSIDYPVELQTKNPGLMVQITKDQKAKLEGRNLIIAVTLITLKEQFLKVIEPRAPTAKARLEGIRGLVDLGAKVLVKMQPIFYPEVIDEAPEFAGAFKDAGAFGVTVESFKLRTSLARAEKDRQLALFQKALGRDVLEGYIPNHGTGDTELVTDLKNEYVRMVGSEVRKTGMKFWAADNCDYTLSDSCECCGTELLRDYRIFGQNERTAAWPKTKTRFAEELPRCFVNFTKTASTRRSDGTMPKLKRLVQ